MSPETAFVGSPCLWWGAFVIVVELLDGLGGEVVEVLVRPLGVEPPTHSAVASSTWLTSRQGPCRRMTSFLNDPTVVSARSRRRPTTCSGVPPRRKRSRSHSTPEPCAVATQRTLEGTRGRPNGHWSISSAIGRTTWASTGGTTTRNAPSCSAGNTSSRIVGASAAGGCVFPTGVAACHGHCSSCRCSSLGQPSLWCDVNCAVEHVVDDPLSWPQPDVVGRLNGNPGPPS